MSLAYLPLFFFGSSVLEFFQVDEAVAEEAGRYTRLTYVGWVLNVQGMVVSTFLKTQEVTCPQMISNVAEFLVHLGLLYLMTSVWQLGFDGVCFALLATNALNCIDMYFILFCNCKNIYNPQTYVTLRRQHFHNCSSYLRVAIPAAFMTLVEWLVYDLLLILVVPLGEGALAAQTIIVNLQNFLYIMSQGWQDAVQTLVGNAIGAGNSKLAKANARLIIMLGVIANMVVVGLLYLARTSIIGSMVRDPVVLAIILSCF